MKVTFSPIVILVRLSQPLNALVPIEVILFVITTLVKERQPPKSPSPITVTFVGICIVLRVSH